jgi:hypothetical protein
MTGQDIAWGCLCRCANRTTSHVLTLHLGTSFPPEHNADSMKSLSFNEHGFPVDITQTDVLRRMHYSTVFEIRHLVMDVDMGISGPSTLTSLLHLLLFPYLLLLLSSCFFTFPTLASCYDDDYPILILNLLLTFGFKSTQCSKPTETSSKITA